MSSVRVAGNAKHSTVRAVVTRADGRVEDLGVIAFYHRNPVINAVGQAFIKAKETFRGRTRSE